LHDAQTAGIDGRDWDATLPGAATVDAVHRGVLLRFPSSAPEIKKRLDSGLEIATAEIVLEYDGHELSPPGYVVRTALGQKKWKADAPRWHVVAWALRRPWFADKARGPTFNAYVNGAGYWTRYGASDIAQDRHAARFGPAEVSQASTLGRLDITPLLTDAAYGRDLAARIRAFEQHGLLLKKLETYDVRYRDHWEAYEWAVPTGGHGIRFRNARLEITFRPLGPRARKPQIRLEPAIDLSSLLGAIQGNGGAPTAVMPTPEQFSILAQRAALAGPSAMPEWQLRRVLELYGIGGDRVSGWAKAVAAGDYKQYEQLVRSILAIPPRYWQGWTIQDDLLVWYLYRDLLPAYVQDHIKAYWDAWLMPDIPTEELFHPQSKEAAAYWEKTKDWRGRTSFFRDGYNYRTSTQNFNHTAAMGALLGGYIVGSQRAMADGRHGLEHFPLRLWAVLDGSTQEMLDHYYFSITLSALKMFVDFGPEHIDRLMARIILDRSVELLATAFHPYLKRAISSSGRARLPGILLEQDGIYGVLHTLSRKGAVNYLDRPFRDTVEGMPVWGYDFPPGRVALQSTKSPWASEWVSNIIDDKVFPFEETSTDTTRGMFNPPLWRRAYLGRHYGLASQDIKGGAADVMAQWIRTAGPAARMQDLGTLTARYIINDPDMSTTRGGTVQHGGGLLTFQHRNRAIVCAKPRSEKDRLVKLAGDSGMKELATVIALWNFEQRPAWRIYVDGREVKQLPAKVKAGQVITLEDGAAYVGIIPLPATDLGRTAEVVISSDTSSGKVEPNGAQVRPAVTISSYNLLREAAVPLDALDWTTVNTATYGGFVIELGDAAEYGGFEAFAKRMRGNRVTTRWDSGSRVFHVAYRSGADTLEMGCSTDYPSGDVHAAIPPGTQAKAIPYRRINGNWPYLPPAIDRDTTLAQQGSAGRLEKNGAVLLTDKGRKAYLQTEPISGIFTAYNLVPDPTAWSFSVPGAITLEADGKVSLLRLAVQPREARVWVDYAAKPGQSGPEMAAALRVTGFTRPPIVELNGERVERRLEETTVDGKRAYVLPLTASSKAAPNR
jgi:hypothetical protein